jgi:hypothetical protein
MVSLPLDTFQVRLFPAALEPPAKAQTWKSLYDRPLATPVFQESTDVRRRRLDHGDSIGSKFALDLRWRTTKTPAAGAVAEQPQLF